MPSEPVAAGAPPPAPAEVPAAEAEPEPSPADELAAAEGAPPAQVASAARHPLHVRIVHGSLQYASEPVAVGHYQGMPISGAEGFLDQRLGGLLNDRLLLGAYAEQEGSAVLVAPVATEPPGGIVLGLGPTGEVTTSKVTRAMTEAALLRALEAAERIVMGPQQQPTEPVVVGVSTVLVGTNPLDGMSIEASLAALIEGVVAAIRVMQANPRLWSKVRIGHLEVIERYAERATAALKALASIADLSKQTGGEVEVVPHEELVVGKEGIPGQPPDNYNEAFWWRLDIRSNRQAVEPAEGYRELEFTSMARRARADRLLQRVEVATVNDLIAKAVTQTSPDPQICNTLYELLVPGELKYELFNADNLHLLLDHDTACYPWEALAPRYSGGDKPLARRTGVLRQFAERETRNARFMVRRATGTHVLVIGNPPAGDPWPDLPGAYTEAAAVADFLANQDQAGTQYTVHALMWNEDGPDTRELPEADEAESWIHVVNALYRFEYRIVHVAAHGLYDADDPSHSGVVIGPGRFLTAQTVKQLPVVPELVFLNCCHSGRLGDLPGSSKEGGSAVNLLAASVARQLMDTGVRAVIAAGWAVDDTAAPLFATTFYEHALMAGAGFGDAVRAARQAVRGASESLTWAAYQCYGDPEFRLRASPDW